MQRTIVIFVLVVASNVSNVLANESNDTLLFLLSKSDLILRGRIVSEPVGIIFSDGVVDYLCDYTVFEVLKGDPILESKTIKINIRRFEIDEKDKHPLVDMNSECVLFLDRVENQIPNMVTSDFWFGIQYPSPYMIDSIRKTNETSNK